MQTLSTTSTSFITSYLNQSNTIKRNMKTNTYYYNRHPSYILHNNMQLLQLKLKLSNQIEEFLLDMIFPQQEEIKRLDPQKELCHLKKLAICNTKEEITIAHKSLTSFLLEWGKCLEKADGIDKLPTPIFCIPFDPPPSPPSPPLLNAPGDDNDDNEYDDDDDDDEGNSKIINIKDQVNRYGNDNINDIMIPIEIDNENKEEKMNQMKIIHTSGVKVSFRKTKRYLSRNEQRGLEKGQIPDRKGAKIDSWSPGGIHFIIQTLQYEEEELDNEAELVENEPFVKEVNDNVHVMSIKLNQKKIEMYELRLVAKRCDIDRDTVVKVSSERTIIRRLRDAIRIWNKMRSL